MGECSAQRKGERLEGELPSRARPTRLHAGPTGKGKLNLGGGFGRPAKGGRLRAHGQDNTCHKKEEERLAS